MKNPFNKSNEIQHQFWLSGKQKAYFAIMLFMWVSAIAFFWYYKPGHREDNLFFRISFIILLIFQGLMWAVPTFRSLIHPHFIFNSKGIQTFEHRPLRRTKKIIIPSEIKLYAIINERRNIFQISIEDGIIGGPQITLKINNFQKEDQVVLRKIFEGIAESKIYDFQQVTQLIDNAKNKEK
jgi:hypothetical protein